jgi:Protein of unknown function (DUF3102)
VSDWRKAFGMEEESGGTEIATRQKQDVARAEELAEEIRREFNRAWGYYKSELRSCLRMGKLLIEAKAAVPHGAWEEWISNNCPFTSRTASNWMKLARNEERVEEYLAKPETVSDSLSMREVLKALEPPKPKPPTQEQETNEESTSSGVTRTARYQPKRTLEQQRRAENEQALEGEVIEEEEVVETETYEPSPDEVHRDAVELFATMEDAEKFGTEALENERSRAILQISHLMSVEYEQLYNQHFAGHYLVEFFEDISDGVLEAAIRYFDNTQFHLKELREYCEQILEERREKAQGQTSILDSKAEGEDSE